MFCLCSLWSMLCIFCTDLPFHAFKSPRYQITNNLLFCRWRVTCFITLTEFGTNSDFCHVMLRFYIIQSYFALCCQLKDKHIYIRSYLECFYIILASVVQIYKYSMSWQKVTLVPSTVNLTINGIIPVTHR